MRSKKSISAIKQLGFDNQNRMMKGAGRNGSTPLPLIGKSSPIQPTSTQLPAVVIHKMLTYSASKK
jgi:hypothetical protein